MTMIQERVFVVNPLTATWVAPDAEPWPCAMCGAPVHRDDTALCDECQQLDDAGLDMQHQQTGQWAMGAIDRMVAEQEAAPNFVPALDDHSMGYELYMRGKSIKTCRNLLQRRGWKAAEFDCEDAYWRAMMNEAAD